MTRCVATTACSILLSLSACVGSPEGDADLAALESTPALVADIGGEALAERLVDRALVGESHALLRSLCETAPGRLAGTPELERAVQWGVERMRAMGLARVRAEEVEVPVWERGQVGRAIRLDAAGAEAEELDVLALGGSVGTPAEGLVGDLLMVRSFEELEARSEEARGRIVFFNRPMPRVLRNTFMAYGQAVPQRVSGASEAARHGAVGVLVRSMTTRIDDLPHTGSMVYVDGLPRIPALAISTRDAEALSARLDAGAEVRVRLIADCRPAGTAVSANVVGDLPGSDLADELVVVGGHLDAWDVGAGAHDDGAGCVHALEAVRLLQEVGFRPRRTLRVVLFTNEESGLRGGRAYAAAHADERHFAAVESDRGGFVPKGFTTTVGAGALFDTLDAALAGLDREGMGALLPGGGGADIGPLREHGAHLFGLVTLAHRYFDYHHSEADVPGAVNERELALGSAAVAYLLAVLADVE